MKQFNLLLIIVVSVLLASCDRGYGSQRTGVIAQLPSPAVVVAALESTPRVQRVTQHKIPAQITSSLYRGTENHPAFYQFIFEDGVSSGVVEIKQDAQGINHIELYSLWINQSPSKAQFNQARKLLDAAYLSLRRSVPSLPPLQAIKETLMGYPSE